MMTQNEAELLIKESERFIGLKYAAIQNPDISEHTFVASKVNCQGEQCFPVALLRSVLYENNIEEELVAVVEYFRKLSN